MPFTPKHFTNSTCSFIVKLFKSSPIFGSLYKPKETEDLANDPKTTLILQKTIDIHPGSSDSPINNTSCQRAKLKLKREHCSKPRLKVGKFLQASEILGKKGKLAEIHYKVNT